MMLRNIFFYVCMIGMVLPSMAQDQFYKITPLPLNDLSAFSDPGKNWKIVGNVQGSYDDAEPQKQKGTGILYNDFKPSIEYKEEANLFTGFEHGDIFLSLDFLIPQGSNSGIYFQGRYEIQLFDSWLVKMPRTTDCGSIYERWDDTRPEGKKGYEGHPARTNAGFAPNVWQHLEVEFHAPRFDASGKKTRPARFSKVKLNGIVIHENVVLNGPTRAAAHTNEQATGKLMIQGDHGIVAFRNIEYALLNDFNVDVADLQYSYYEGKFDDLSQLTPGKVTRTGKADAIDVKLADNPNAAALVFNGKLDLKEADEYQFTIKKIGQTQLKIDGEVIVKPGDLFGDEIASKKLMAGEHTFELSYLKNFSWAPSGIGLLIGKSNARPVALHVPSSLPAVPPVPLISVAAASEPEIIRSFMEHDGRKKTQVISVGTPAMINYSYDLNQGALLQVWRGDFLNVTDMWHERGEPQTASSMGAPVVLTGGPAVTIAEHGKNALLPDTLNYITDLHYKGYVLNASRNPGFLYQYKDLSIEDSFEPEANGQGLKRSLTLSNVDAGQVVLVRLASGKAIEKMDDNIFAVDQRFFIRLAPDKKLKPEIRTSGNRSELLIPCAAPVAIQYTIVW